MNTQKNLEKKSHTTFSGSLVATLSGIIVAVVFMFPASSWSQDAEWTIYNTSNSGMPYNGVAVLAFDEQGSVWVGTGRFFAVAGGGLAKFDGESWTVYNSANSPLPHNDHTGLAVDPEGNVWAGIWLSISPAWAQLQIVGLPIWRRSMLIIRQTGKDSK